MPFATIELVIVILLIIVNGVFAMSETAFVSARKVRLQQWANEGNDKAAAALALANSPNRLLSTVQLGITLIGKNSHIPPGFTVGRNVVVGTDLAIDDFGEFDDKVIPNGKKIPVDRKRQSGG